MATQFPKQLYLQVGDDDGVNPDWRDWTHCDERIYKTDIVYVRAGTKMAELADALHIAEKDRHKIETALMNLLAEIGFKWDFDFNTVNKAIEALKLERARHNIVTNNADSAIDMFTDLMFGEGWDE